MSPAPGSAPELAVGAVVVRESKLLMVRRANPPEAGRWSLPGGRVAAGETLAAAVEREMLEETSLECRCGPFRGWVERISGSYHFVILDFDVVLLDEREPRAGGDAAEVEWVALGALDSVETVSGLAEFLRSTGVLSD